MIIKSLLIHFQLELYFVLKCTEARPRTPSLAELPLHSSQVFIHTIVIQHVCKSHITEARTGRELELLRSHPKDERGSVREIGLRSTVGPNPHFLELSPTVWPLLTCCTKWSLSGPLGGPEMDSFGDPKWSPLGTRNGPI